MTDPTSKNSLDACPLSWPEQRRNLVLFASCTGMQYLAAFVIFGAGELIGVYSPNYMVSASKTKDLRRTMAFATMLMVPAAPAGYLYGAIVDFVKSHKLTALGLTPESLGFRLSFLTSSILILCGIAVAVTLLPKRPRPPEDSPSGSD